jgi:hypothetical protein
MKKQKPLIETKPYLKNPMKYRKALLLNVASSIAIETGASVESIARRLIDASKTKRIKKPRGSRH